MISMRLTARAVAWFRIVVTAVVVGLDRYRQHVLFDDALRTLPSRRRLSLPGCN